jgi:NAD(P)-dependent dehydrogenase (short-subunit alcohol dehydrogenase family)
MGQLDGKLAVITGAARGIGLAVARRFLAEGASVVITDIREKELQEAAAGLEGDVTAVAADITDVADIDRLYAPIRERGRTIDVLVANAGIDYSAPVDQVTEEGFDLLVNVNFRGTFFTLQRALPIFSPSGSVIFMGSVSAAGGYPEIGVYSGTKAALRALTRSLVAELGDRGIRVNTLSPGPIETEMLQQYPGGVENLPHVPLGRLGRPEEIASAALFLASDESSFVTGVELFADGGLGQI